MAQKLINTTTVLLLLIVVAIATTTVFLYLQLRTDSVQAVIARGEVVRTIVVAHNEDTPFLAVLLVYNPVTRRMAVIDLPSTVGMVLRPLGRVDGIGALFDSRDTAPYRRQIEQLTGVSIPFVVSFSRPQLVNFIDLLGGVELFIITDYSDAALVDPVLLPSGLVLLDGERAVAYLTESPAADHDIEQTGRRQSFFQALVRQMHHHGDFLQHPDVVPHRDRFLSTELESRAVSSWMRTFGTIVPDRLVRRRIQGTVRRVDVAGVPRDLLFPHFEGQWLQQSVQQVEQTIAGQDEDFSEAIAVTVEILNGTGRTGLARRTAELYEGFGFEVIRVGNAESSDYATTVFIDRRGVGDLAEKASEVIRGQRVVTDVLPDSDVDVTIILGGDFDGNRVRPGSN